MSSREYYQPLECIGGAELRMIRDYMVETLAEYPRGSGIEHDTLSDLVGWLSDQVNSVRSICPLTRREARDRQKFVRESGLEAREAELLQKQREWGAKPLDVNIGPRPERNW